MQPGDNTPPIPAWFMTEVLAMLACYPGAQAGRATVAAWWRQLHKLPEEAIKYGLEKAPQAAEKKEFPPSAFLVLDHAKAWHPPTPRPDYSRPSLPEPPMELEPGNPLHDELANINARMKNGELKGLDVMRAVVKAVCDT